MLRIRAVRSLLVEDVGGVLVPPGGDAAETDGGPDRAREALRRAERKALAMATVSWAAIAVVLAFHEGSPRLFATAGAELVFTLVVLLVAVLSGFRLGQWEKLRSVARAVDELAEREGEP